VKWLRKLTTTDDTQSSPMNTQKLFLSFAVALFGLIGLAAAATQNTEAVVMKISGNPTMQLPGGGTLALQVGSKVPQGAIISSGAGGEVYLQAHTGTVATVKSNSTVSIDELSVTTEGGKVTKETTAINLKNGNLVSTLDPAKKSVNSYQVRTPKGVAAARGTTFTVSYNGVDYTIVATTGFVEITSSTGAVISISGGQASLSGVNGGTATAIGNLPAAQKAEVIQAMAVAIATIAVEVENNMLGSGGGAQLADATATVLRATPEAAVSIAQLVEGSAPGQIGVIMQTVREVAPQETPAVDQAIRTPGTTSTTNGAEATPQTTTPQPIDPSTISHSGG
jgi:FecR protein